ncbi:MAG: IS607 family transposase [Candidatus Heimdallarchaeota archaeon]
MYVYTVSQASILLGVCPTTIRRWDKSGSIKCYRTSGGHRRIAKEEINRIISGKKRRYARRKRGVAIYCRVSSHEQKKKGDLRRQQEVLREYCEAKKIKITDELSDVASGLNARRNGVLKLCKLVVKGRISKVVITYKDRLTRFGFDYLKNYFDSYGVQIISIKARQTPTVQEEMVDDLIAIITSFSGKIYGMRSGKRSNKRKKRKENQFH